MSRGIIYKRYAKCASQEEAMTKLVELNEILDRLDQELLDLPDGNDVYRKEVQTE
jgi:hypothetical protein